MNTQSSAFCVLAVAVLSCMGCRDRSTEHKAAGKMFTGPKFTANIRTTNALTPKQERPGFKLPEGFGITLFASEPDIGKPKTFASDARGRRCMTQSFEDPFPYAAGKGKDKLTILEDTDHDGRADKFIGKVLSGLYRRDDGAVTAFVELSGKEFSLSKKDIAEKIASKLTLMPDNFVSGFRKMILLRSYIF